MESEGSLPEPYTGLYPELDESNPQIPTLFPLSSILTSSSHLCLGLLSGLFPSGFRAKIFMVILIPRLPVTCTTHLILLDLITLKIFCEAPYYEVFSSLPPVPPS